VAAEADVYTWPGLVRAIVERVGADRTALIDDPVTSLATPRIEP
jgi:hypothetical protein